MIKSDMYFILNYEKALKETIKAYEKLEMELTSNYFKTPMPLIHIAEYERFKRSIERDLNLLKVLLENFKYYMENNI